MREMANQLPTNAYRPSMPVSVEPIIYRECDSLTEKSAKYPQSVAKTAKVKRQQKERKFYWGDFSHIH